MSDNDTPNVPHSSEPAPDQPPTSPAGVGAMQDTVLRRVLIAAGIVIVLAGVKAASSLIVPILLAGFFATISWPMISLVARGVEWVNNRIRRLFGKDDKRTRSTSFANLIGIGIVLTGILGILGGLGAMVFSSVRSFVADFQGDEGRYSGQFQSRYGDLFDNVSALLARLGVEFDFNRVQDLLDPSVIFNHIGGILNSVTSAASNTVYLIALLIFIIIELAILPKKLEMANTSEKNKKRFGDAVDKIQAYILIKSTLSMFTAGTIGVVIAFLGVPYAALWGALTFVLNFIPAFGSILASIPPILLALLVLDVPSIIGVIAIYLAVNLIIDNALEPRLMGDKLGLSPLVVFLSLVFWGWLLGPIGMPLSTPLTMIVKIMLTGSKEFIWAAVFLGDGKETDDSEPFDSQTARERFRTLGVTAIESLRRRTGTTSAIVLPPAEGRDADTIKRPEATPEPPEDPPPEDDSWPSGPEI